MNRQEIIEQLKLIQAGLTQIGNCNIQVGK